MIHVIYFKIKETDNLELRMTVFYNIRQIVRKILVMKYNFNV